VTSTALQLSAGGNDGYLINSRSAQGYGLVIANTTSNNNGKITISNSSANIFSMTCTAPNVLDVGAGSITSTGALTASQLTLSSGGQTSVLTTSSTGLNVADNITVSAQTYPLPSSNQVATISYVNQVATQIVSQYTIGQIIQGIFTTPPLGFLYTDGTYYSTQLYPQLYALIGNAYDESNGGTQPGMYSVPNTIQRFLVDSNGTITSAGKQIPSYGDAFNNNLAFGGSNQTSFFVTHSHGYGTGYSNVAVGSNSGTCATLTGGTPCYYNTLTGGNGAAIKNIPYYMAINNFIYAGPQ
jgi:hypothetical protein